MRSGTVIPGDGDMDVYTWEEDKLREHLIDFYERGLKVRAIIPGIYYSFHINPLCSIDVYIYGELKGLLSLPWRFSCVRIADYETPRKFFTGYREIEFLGEKVLCPENPERLLEFWYGSDWRIPQDKKERDRVKSAQFFRYIRKGFRFIFNKRYRQQVIWRREKNGSFFNK